MSEAEKQRRLLYKLNRKKWLRIIAIVLGAVLLLTLASTILLYKFNKAYYINYTEKSSIDYKVSLKENDFYESEYAEQGKAYVASLIDSVIVDFKYRMQMDKQDVEFEYSYRVDAVLQVKDKGGAVIFDHTDSIFPAQTVKTKGDCLVLSQNVSVEYGKYNELAERFVSFYDLKDTHSVLILQMHMNVIGSCEDFSESNNNAYVFSLNVPLASQIVNMTMTSAVEEGDNQILACENAVLKTVFTVLSIVFGSLLLLGAIFMIVFTFITRNPDINYEAKIKRLLSSYKSFIQRIHNQFDTADYQVLYVDTFNEMLEIRDTLQAPILMYENGDKTCTQFVIPTNANTNILYMFEIKVEDFDEIYGEEA